ncbi:MAG: response regulator [Cyanobacteria bacterium P01_C01_bin.121]
MTGCIQSSEFVLIVDDTPTNISVLAQTLRQANLSIRIANDGLSALAQVRKIRPSLILLDVQMPGIDGFETCRRLKADAATRDIPVIFMTALSDKASRVEGLSLGAVDYIAKPFERAEVLARIKVHLQLKRLTEQLENTVNARTRTIQETQDLLIEQEKLAALGQLMAGVAHEINNPMTCIANNIGPAHEYVNDLTELIKLYREHLNTPVPAIDKMWEACDIEFAMEDLPKLLNSMALSIERIKALSTSLRSFSRGESAEPVTFDIHHGLDSTLVILGHRLKSANAKSSVSVSKHYSELPPVRCFPSAMNQVFMNILANALDALEETNEPTIEIVTRRVENESSAWVHIEIADNGPGMTAETQKHLFDALYTTKPVDKGTGLGLSISREIVEKRHNGRLVCESLPGQGCRFIVMLPAG